jgi:hypothetical protein
MQVAAGPGGVRREDGGSVLQRREGLVHQTGKRKDESEVKGGNRRNGERERKEKEKNFNTQVKFNLLKLGTLFSTRKLKFLT